ncbi:MAG TPA: FliH/SctL family protein [Jatrophihabitans sp.]|uniref:FliH/SctL family protein n=1 Tax=Jatrophihabitans sp. TaxID=1932789 RepID=UPI002F23595F
MPDTVAFEFISDIAVPDRLIEQARGQARAVGYAQGWSQGSREAADSGAAERAAAQADREFSLAAHRQRVDSAVQALHGAAAQLEQTTMSITGQIEDQILAAAVELAEVLLGRELRDPEVAAPAALARILRLAPAGEPVTVWLNPADYDTLTGPAGTALIGSVEGATGRGITFETDPDLRAGDALARCASTTIDARLVEGVARLREYLGR